jgi:flavin reductase (DIM6/NTAB) family NADH-FMN oxidoreductase RutF
VADPVDGFDTVVARLDAGMVVVTAAADGEQDGCLVGFHSQVSIHPRRYVVWLSVKNRTFRLAEAATHLAVHSLGAEDHALAERFGGATADDEGVDKLAGLTWSPGPGGAPELADLPVRFVGTVVAQVETPDGDHVGFLLDPLTAEGADGRPGPPLRQADVLDIDAGHSA